MSEKDENAALLGLTAQIVSAHVRNHSLPSEALPGLIEKVFNALANAGQVPRVEAVERPAPSVANRRSIYPDYIICLEDGRKLKTLKRHLRSTYDMSPEDYREKWGLPADYPMVAPNYAEKRSSLAKQLGLGRKPAAVATAPVEAPVEPTKGSMTQVELSLAAPVGVAAPEPAAPPAPVAAAPARRADHSAASVFANFPTPGTPVADAEPEPDAASVEAGLRRKGRKPFSKQFARGMRG